MSASKKLSSSVKAICYLAETHPIPQNSRQISKAIGINASKLRQLLSLLTKNDIVESKKGTLGGFLLKQKPEQLDLQKIYCAIEDRKAFHLDVSNRGKQKLQSQKFSDFFLNLFADIQVDIEYKMKGIKISDIMKRLDIKSKLN
jgi:Rrf2 family protein